METFLIFFVLAASIVISAVRVDVTEKIVKMAAADRNLLFSFIDIVVFLPSFKNYGFIVSA